MDMRKRIPPLNGQESVWDYPRPPRVAPTNRRVRVVFNGIVIADTTKAIRILETSHPPTFYLPPADIQMQYLVPTEQQSYCEFKGLAAYYDIRVDGKVAAAAAWYYPAPTPGYEAITQHLAFYPSRMEACFVDEEQVRAQAGDFYGGWITDDVVGPFKGESGTNWW